MLNAIEKFAAAAAWSIFLNLAMIATLLSARWFSQCGLCGGVGRVAGGRVCNLIFIVWAAARSHLRLRFGLAALDAGDQGILAGAGRGHLRLGQHADRAFHRQSDRELPAVGRSDRALLCRPHQPVADGHARHRARHGAAAGNVVAAGGGRSQAARMPRRTVPPRWRCCSRCRSWPPIFTVPLTIMRALFAHGAFHLQAAIVSAHALMAYGVGCPRSCWCASWHPPFMRAATRRRPCAPRLLSVAVNIALKFVLGLGIALRRGRYRARHRAGRLGECRRAGLDGARARL